MAGFIALLGPEDVLLFYIRHVFLAMYSTHGMNRVL